jgi:hypothetical protein
MAKRGETRPWRVRYEWENGVKGCETYRTEGDALRFADEVRRNSERNDMTVQIDVTARLPIGEGEPSDG